MRDPRKKSAAAAKAKGKGKGNGKAKRVSLGPVVVGLFQGRGSVCVLC